MNIQYFWFVYQKTVGTAIQDMKMQSAILDYDLVFLASGTGTGAPHILK